jgi:peptidoglycan/xylan/chitin deacetylase (PgdA/CDA1 family)
MRAIMYHYVRPDDPELPYFRHLRLDAFRSQLDHLARESRLISMEEFEASVSRGEPVEDGVVLTFDDGVADHYRHVFPELARRNIPGIFYVPTNPLETGKLLEVHRIHLLLGAFGGQAVLEALKKHLSSGMLSHNHVREFHERTYRWQTNDECTKEVKRTLNYLIDYAVRPRLMDALMGEFFTDESGVTANFYVNPEQLREMQAGGMVIGSHTVNHLCMSKLSVDEQTKEITGSFAFLETILGRPRLKTFCYPYGGFHSFTAETERLLDQAGCLFSFNVEPREIAQADLKSRRQALPRFDCNTVPAQS